MFGMVSMHSLKRASVAVATVARVLVVGALFALVLLAGGGTAAVAQSTTTAPTSTIPDVCDPGPDAPDDPIPGCLHGGPEGCQAPALNPPLPAGCGLDVMLVVDSSSIDRHGRCRAGGDRRPGPRSWLH